MSQKPNTILTLFIIIAIVLSMANTYTIINLSKTQTRQIAEIQGANQQVYGKISDIESTLINLSYELESLVELRDDLEDISAKIDVLEDQVGLNSEFLSYLGSELVDLSSDFYRFNSSIITTIDEIESSISQFDKTLDDIADQTPAIVYDATHKSVVIVRADTKQGSGFIWKNVSYVLTNWHVVNETNGISVEFYDGHRREASLVGLDAYSDVAVLRVSDTPPEAQPLEFLNSTEIYIGQRVVTIGNPLGYSGSLSSGFISQINEKIDLPPLIVPVLQLDVTIAPGSSGSPLLDMSGNVLGITNAGSRYGFNFAIPSNIVERVANSIVKNGSYSHPLVGFYGVILTPEIVENMNILNVDRFQHGILVVNIIQNYPAEEAGLQAAEQTVDDSGKPAYRASDIIIAVDGITIRSWSDWDVYFTEQVFPEQIITLTLWRDGEIIDVELITAFREQYGG